MKWTAIIAMVFVGVDCLKNAQENVIFSEGYSWIWYFVALAWFINAIAAIYKLENKQPL